MKTIYSFETNEGTAVIGEHNGHFIGMFEDEELEDVYSSPEEVAEALSQEFTTSFGVDVPNDLSEWTRHARRRFRDR